MVARDASAQPRVRAKGPITALSYSPDGGWLAVGTAPEGGGGAVELYVATSRSRPSATMPGLSKPVTFVGFTHGGKYLAAADEAGTLVVWSVPDGAQVMRVELPKKKGTDNEYRFMAHPHAPYVAWLVRARGGVEGVVEVVRVPDGKVVTSANRMRVGEQAAWSLHGGHLLIDGVAFDWDHLATYKPKRGGVSETSSDGQRVVSTNPNQCDDFLTVAELASKKVLRSIALEEGGCPRHLWFADQDRALVWIGQRKPSVDGKDPIYDVYLWDERRDKQRALKKDLGRPIAAALSHDRKSLAVTDGRDVVYVSVR
ncbi:MAG TPA: hypothetical protein VML75_27585 [Kofleriaceae bacterium]|nr:hypothetical protein [Kofleriaceae bacterium]